MPQYHRTALDSIVPLSKEWCARALAIHHTVLRCSGVQHSTVPYSTRHLPPSCWSCIIWRCVSTRTVLYCMLWCRAIRHVLYKYRTARGVSPTAVAPTSPEGERGISEFLIQWPSFMPECVQCMHLLVPMLVATWCRVVQGILVSLAQPCGVFQVDAFEDGLEPEDG